MSKLIFSTLSILVLLLSGVNCSTGRGGKGSQIDELKEAAEIPRVITCKVGLVLNPGDECNGSDSSGLDYSLRNNAGELDPKGAYIDSNRVSIPNTISISNTIIGIDSIGTYKHGSLYLTRNDKAWTIRSLP